MESKEHFENAVEWVNLHRNGRCLCMKCKDKAINCPDIL